MTKEELLNQLDKEFIDVIDNEKGIEIKIKDSIETQKLLDALKMIYDFESSENQLTFLNLKGLPTSLITEAIKYSLTREDLKNPCMLLNIINLIKIYNTLDDTFFEDEKIYISSIEDLLDVKLDLTEELSDFQRQISIYFISLFKSYNKLTYEPLDKHIALPEIYKNIIMSLDILTLSGIFSVSKKFSTDDCIYIENGCAYLTELLMKGSLSSYLMNKLLGEVECQTLNQENK